MRLSQKAYSVLNDEKRISNQAMWFTRLENLFSGTNDPYLENHAFVLHGITGVSRIDFLASPEDYILDCLEDLAVKIDKSSEKNAFTPACIECEAYGVHFIDKLFGADVYNLEDQNNQPRDDLYRLKWQAHYLKTPIGELKEPDLERDETFALMKRAVQTFLDQKVKLPIFGLPTIGSVLNVALNLYGQEMLLAMASEREATVHDLAVIQKTLVSIHRWFRGVLPPENLQCVCAGGRTQPYNFGQLCGCSTQLISGEHYRELIEPFDSELLKVYPNGGMIHLCGSHLQHIETFRNMEALRAVQVNDRAAEDLEDWFNGLREDQIIYWSPCERISTEKALKITGGRRMVFVGVPVDEEKGLPVAISVTKGAL